LTSPWLTVKYAEALAQGGADVNIFSISNSTDGFDRGIVKSNVPFTVFPSTRELPFVWRSAALNMLRVPLPSLALLRALIRHSADFVIAGQPQDLYLAWCAARMHSAELVYIPFEYYPGLSYGDKLTCERFERLESYFARRVHSWVSCGDKLSELYIRQYALEGKVHTVYSSVPRQADCTPRGLRKQIGASADTIILFYSGQVTDSRGLWDVLQALRGAPDHLWFVVIGMGDVHRLRTAVLELGLTHRVHVLDRVPQDHLMGYTAEADIGIIPIHDVSLSYHYCNPSKLFEYIGAGLPLIVSSVEQLKWYVETRQLGEVFQTGSPTSMANAINKLVKDQAYRRMCAANVRRVHETEACWEIQAEKLRTAVLGESYRARGSS
jgi:glycosyltransferase involved in cell wall biosynthesis